MIALDRVKLVEPSELHGVELSEGETLPVAFVKDRSVPKYGPDAAGNPVGRGSFAYREGLKLLNGKRRTGGLLELRDGTFAPEASLRILPARDSYPSFATGDRKWIDISIRQQTLVAYVGKRPVYATLVSTGRAGMGDPETTQSTVRGTFMIYQKEVSSTMDGDEDKSDSFNLRDVPFVQYFHKGYALHGTYWHDDFGKVQEPRLRESGRRRRRVAVRMDRPHRPRGLARRGQQRARHRGLYSRLSSARFVGPSRFTG